uniref:Adaptin_N domain-containing protein n=1 Tax=Heterorhabditis bacteriophora TaxID=37862 RepID=A0A1I7X0G9_HETBA
MAILSVKSMSRLLISSPHFNYGNNIISTLVRISLCSNSEVVNNVCDTLSQLFHDDLNLKVTLFATRCISSLVTKRKGHVPPQLISTFLALNIRVSCFKDNFFIFTYA